MRGFAIGFFILCIIGGLGLYVMANSVQGEYAAFIFEDDQGRLFMWDPEVQEQVFVSSQDDIKRVLREFREKR